MTDGTCEAEGCDRDAELRGLCRKDYKRARRAGTLPTKTRRNGEAQAIIEQGAASPGDGPCVMLLAANRPKTTLDGVTMSASRAVWIMANGDPGNAWVLHTCGRGTEGCVRLGHLYLGTAQQNTDDRLDHGAHFTGSRHQNAKLTEEDVRAIRATPRAPAGRPRKGASYVTADELAARYGVSRGAIAAIQNGRGWEHV
jgi:hypothetical protein